MTKIFPDAIDYKTINHAISSQDRAIIEEKLGFPLLPGQTDQFQYFEMSGPAGKKIGTIIAASQKGEFGAIEFVFGVDTSGIIKGIYIQRSREKDIRFKERSFLDLFIGKKIGDENKFSSIYKGPQTPGTEAVIKGLQKELLVFRYVKGMLD